MPSLFSFPVVLAALQWIAGFLLKRWPKFPNAAIPVITFVLSLFGFAVVPQPANAAFGTLLGQTGNIFLAALVQTVGVTGFHGLGKNSVAPFALNLFTQLFAKKA